jgi:CheY-like chemotaxis protein
VRALVGHIKAPKISLEVQEFNKPVRSSWSDMTAQIIEGKKILLVHNEESNRHVLRLMLKNHSCAEATSGAEALEMLKSEHFALVITEHLMAEMRGDALASRIKQLNPGTPVVLTTWNDTSIDRAKCAADVILTVPWRISELEDALLVLLKTKR